jgi:tellurite resistance protein TehA-like permease
MLFAAAAVAWVALAAVACWRWLRARAQFLAEARSPAGLTGVAACAVLGTRLVMFGWPAAAIFFLVLAGVSWPVLVTGLLRRLPRRAAGEWFMLTVATAAVGALAAALAARKHAGWLAIIALLFTLGGVALYPLVLVRFDLRQLSAGDGDHWVAGGSLAISALAVAQLAMSSQRVALLSGLAGALRIAAVVVWIAAIVWLPALVVAELRRPRPRYHVRRWATVFPFGMYAAGSFNVGAASSVPAIAGFARVWVWVAVAL